MPPGSRARASPAWGSRRLAASRTRARSRAATARPARPAPSESADNPPGRSPTPGTAPSPPAPAASRGLRAGFRSAGRASCSRVCSRQALRTSTGEATGTCRPSIIQPMDDPAQLVHFYDVAYTQPDPAEAARYARWRALGAVGKADHVLTLCARAGLRAGGHPINTLEIGCGDGALLCELHARGFGGRLAGVEITEAAVDIARGRPEID